MLTEQCQAGDFRCAHLPALCLMVALLQAKGVAVQISMHVSIAAPEAAYMRAILLLDVDAHAITVHTSSIT